MSSEGIRTPTRLHRRERAPGHVRLAPKVPGVALVEQEAARNPEPVPAVLEHALVAAGVDPQLVADRHRKPGRRPELEPADRLRPALDLDGPPGVGAGLEGDGALIEPAIGEAREVLAHGEDPMVGDRLDRGHAREAVVRLQDRGAVRGGGADRGVVSRLARCGGARFDHLVDAVLVAGRARPRRGGHAIERAFAHRLVPPQLRRLDRELAALIAEVGPAVRAEHLERALGERLGQAPQLGVEVALRREARLAQRAAPQPDLAVAVGILPVDERDPDLGAVEQAGAHLVLDDAALGEHPDQIEIVDREPGIAPDRRAREAGIRPVGVAAEHDVPVVIGEEELLAVLPRDPPDRREPRRLLVEMRPHGGGEVLGHGSRKGRREGGKAGVRS